MSHRSESETFCLLYDESLGGIVFVGYYAVEDGVLDGRLEDADVAARRESEKRHYLIAGDGWLEVAYAVALLEVNKFLAYELEVVEEALLALLVAARDVGLAEQHEVVDVVAGLE
jgi:hypothetical protein